MPVIWSGMVFKEAAPADKFKSFGHLPGVGQLFIIQMEDMTLYLSVTS